MSDKKSILAIALTVAVLVLWNMYMKPEPQTQGTQAVQQEAQSSQGGAVEQKATGEEAIKNNADPQSDVTLRESIFKSDLYQVLLSNDGGVPKSWQMKKYSVKDKDLEKNIDVITGTSALQLIIKEANFNVPENPRFKVVSQSENSIKYNWRNNDVVVEKIYTFDPEKYAVDVEINVKNISSTTLNGRIGLDWTGFAKKASGGVLSFAKGPQNVKNPVYFADGSVVRERKITDEKGINRTGAILWAGIEERYFISAIVPRKQGGVDWTVKASTQKTEEGSIISTQLISPRDVITPGETLNNKFLLYVGPKDINRLKDIGVMLEKSIDYGWFTVIAVPILHVLKFFYNVTKNYGVAIILLTILIKILLYPISHKSMKSMKRMQQLQPQLKKIKEKYGSDKQRVNVETMQLFKTYKVNPMGGCLPMVLQFPVYIALYKVLWNSIELFQSPFFWFYKDLSAPDPYYITPILLGFAMLAQQKLTPTVSADPTQQKMMMLMPIMFTAFMLFLPAGLVLYILVNTLFTIAQQWMNNNDIKVMDLLRGKLPNLKKA